MRSVSRLNEKAIIKRTSRNQDGFSKKKTVCSLPEVNWAPRNYLGHLRNYLGHLLKMCNEFETNMSGLQVTAMVMFTGYSVASDHMVRNTLN